MHIAYPTSFLGIQLDGRYRLDRLAGEGASAWVFASHDARLDRAVAVKVLKPRTIEDEPQRRNRFVTEGRTLARLVHPNVVLVHDAGETSEGLGYLVMELCEAGTLETELFRRGTLPVQEAMRLLLPLLGALACAHDRGIVHRDIKPSNIVLLRERDITRAKLLDFGIARPRDSGTESASGTPSYMAPEQAQGLRPAPAVDVWAMGVVLFQTLSGRVPFDGTSSLDGLMKLVNERAPLFSEACPGLGAHLSVALDRALERDTERRYADMRSFAQAVVMACVQDSIALPTRLEPLGLPNLEDWIANADRGGTRTLAPAERAAVAVAPVSSTPARNPGVRVGVAILTVAAIGLLVAWALTEPKETALAGESVRKPRALVTYPPPTLGSAVGPPARVLEGGAQTREPQAEPSRPAPAQEPKSRGRPRRRVLGTAPLAPVAPGPIPAAAPAESAQGHSGVIKNWDW